VASPPDRTVLRSPGLYNGFGHALGSASVGVVVGDAVGAVEGDAVGDAVGLVEGDAVRDAVSVVGAAEADGLADGLALRVEVLAQVVFRKTRQGP